MGLLSRKPNSSHDGLPFAARRFPDTPYSYGETEPWLKHAVDASYWEAEGNYFMAAQLGITAVALAPPDQLAAAATCASTPLFSLVRNAGTGDAPELQFLAEVTDWLLGTGWLEQPWLSPYEVPSPQAGAAWKIFPGAIVALIRRADRAARADLVAQYKPLAVERLLQMSAMLPAWAAQWAEEEAGSAPSTD